jgi:dienelactone hydrolase
VSKTHKHEIVLFHSVLGVRKGITDAAERLRAAGHIVHVPTLYEGNAVFDHYKKAEEYVQSIGSYPELLKRTRAAVADLPSDVVYAGFSNGAASAEYLAATRPGAKAALLFSGALPLEMFLEIGDNGPTGWPPDVPVQLHYSANDPFRDQEWIESFRETVQSSGAPFEFFEYPGEGHLFTDVSLANEYDSGSDERLWERVFSFLEELSAQ